MRQKLFKSNEGNTKLCHGVVKTVEMVAGSLAAVVAALEWWQPWGGGGGPNQPDIEEMLKRSQDRLKQAMPGGGSGWPMMALLLIGALLASDLVWLFCPY